MSTQQTLYQRYLAQLRTNFTKLAKLEFLNPDGSVAFALDNQEKNKRSKAFLQDGNISCALQNGTRRQASVTLANLDNAYEYAVNKIWFGQQIRLSEGLILPDGTEYTIPQGVFLIEEPGEALEPGKKTATFQLVDKWANLDGTLGGNLEGAYSVTAGTNIFAAMASILKLDRYTMESNGANPIDPLSPIFTNWYNGKTQTLTDGTVVSLTDAPYDYLSDDSGTLGDVALGLAEMLAAWIGYNQAGRLVIDPSQDDILDATKPILWEFKLGDRQLLNAEYLTRPAEIFNDIIVAGATDDVNFTARGRAQNRDPASDTCISRIGMKTKRIPMSNYYSNDICQSYAAWQLKRSATVNKRVSIASTQMFHLVENEIITLQRPDKPGNPVERHVIQGFTRPLAQTGSMTIEAISVNDYPTATIIEP
ncbi:MAG: hypothetical protein DBX49_01105 [Clostridia bacterium]|nr:MAG: hypothetical protein DBX49_01105 [Clostridia bacterium]